MNDHDIPEERDLPAGRLIHLKDDLMAQIDHDRDSERRATPAAPHRRRRRIGLVAAALAAGLGLATSLVLGEDDSASANTAMRTDDGSIVVTIRDRRDPTDLQRRITELGVPIVVDFLESGYGCDDSRSTGWAQEPPSDALVDSDPAPPGEESVLVIHPDQLRPGEILAMEVQFDEFDGREASMVSMHLSTSEVGPCVPVPNGSVVDAERGIAGG